LAALTSPAAALPAALVSEALALASSPACSVPDSLAFAIDCAAIGVDGESAEARPCALVAAVLGVSAASVGPADVAWERRAAVEATSAGLSGAPLPRSRFGEFPAPAVPDCERLSAIRAGSLLGSAEAVEPIPAAGASTLAGEPALAAVRAARAGVLDAMPLGLIEGTADVVARATAPAVGVPAPADGASALG